jgi:hypothetical protein
MSIFIYELYDINIGKVRASAASTTDPSTVLDQPQAAAPKPSRPTAADILGLNRQQRNAEQAGVAGQQKISIEMEVDQYLSDSNPGTGVLEFWQVV